MITLTKFTTQSFFVKQPKFWNNFQFINFAIGLIPFSPKLSDQILNRFYHYLIHCVEIVCIWSFSGPFTVRSVRFGLNTERYFVSLRIQSKCGKIKTKKSPNTDASHAMITSATEDKINLFKQHGLLSKNIVSKMKLWNHNIPQNSTNKTPLSFTEAHVFLYFIFIPFISPPEHMDMGHF